MSTKQCSIPSKFLIYFHVKVVKILWFWSFWFIVTNYEICFTSNTLLIPKQDQLIVWIVYRYNKNNERKGQMKCTIILCKFPSLLHTIDYTVLITDYWSREIAKTVNPQDSILALKNVILSYNKHTRLTKISSLIPKVPTSHGRTGHFIEQN